MGYVVSSSIGTFRNIPEAETRVLRSAEIRGAGSFGDHLKFLL